MATKTFVIGNEKFVPELVNYEGRPATIWTKWEFRKKDRAWVHCGKFSTPRKATRAEVFTKSCQL